MVRRGSLVEYTGSGKTFAPGKKLMVHDAKGASVVVWMRGSNGKWAKRTVKATDVKEVVE